MTENECLSLMKAPGDQRPGKWRGSVIQILVTSTCNLNCWGCTQLSQMRRPHWEMTPEQFHQACQSLRGYQGVIGVFGGNAALCKNFKSYCDILQKHFPKEQRGLWCNDPITPENARKMRETFDPAVSNLNVHLSKRAFDLFKTYWPESRPFGLTQDSRHSPCFVAMKDVLRKPCGWCTGVGQVETEEKGELCPKCNGSGQVYDESKAWELISGCDINQRWSAGVGVFRGQLRAWFCEIAMAQSIAHQWDTNQEEVERMGQPCNCGADRSGPSAEVHDDTCPAKIRYTHPDTGLDPTYEVPPGSGKLWWQLPMGYFADQVRKHCHECSVPLRGHGELSQASSPESREQVSQTHLGVYKPKRKDRRVELVTVPAQLGQPLGKVTAYLQNGSL